ncbi:MAG: hypothetical protein P1U74_04515 [Legionellaceae bacterium]|nr:hypothetical protein [Legionellaceae bacterium]
MKFFGNKSILSAVRVFSTRGTLKGKITMEPRDWVQSSMNGWLGMTPDMIQYFRTINDLFHSKNTPIKSLVAFGGTWYQLPAMYNNNPFDVWRNVIAATPAKSGQKALPIELLQRASHQFGLEEVNKDVIRKTYHKLAEIAGEDREIIIRLFHFNNRDMHKDSTYEAIKELRDQGIKNFIISDEHSYATFMKNEEVAEGIVTGLLRSIKMTSGDISYPIQGGIKDFSGSLAPQDAEDILRYTDKMIKEEAAKLAVAGNTVDAERLHQATITLHSHLTDRSQHTVDAFDMVGREIGRDVSTHKIHNVENATHHVMGDEGLTEEQLVYQRKAEEILTKIVRENSKLVVKDYEAGKARPWTGFAGGGTPMIQQFINGVAGLYQLQSTEAEKLLYKHMEDVRDRNKIPPVTPAQKAIADIALLRINNESAGRPLYEGTYTSEAIDVVRNLHPEMAKDKDMLEGAYRQQQEITLRRYVNEKNISLEFKKALQEVGMNSEKTSLDKDKILAVIATFADKGEKLHPLIQDEIIESSGPATRPTRFPDQIANALEVVAEIKARNALKVPEDEAVLLVASLHGRDIGKTLAEHHGDKTKFPALQTQVQKPIIGIKTSELWTSNVAGCVMEDVVHDNSFRP